MQYKVQNQDSNADAMLRPQYHETLKELELKLHEQELFYRKQIKDLDSEMKRKYHSRLSDDSG